MTCLKFVTNESGAVTVDYIVVMAALVGLGFAISDVTGSALSEHSGTVHRELQQDVFTTSWDDQLAFPPGSGCAIC